MHMRACVGIVSNDDDDEIAAALFNIRAYFPLLESRSELTVLTNQARRCVRARVYRGRRRSVKSSSKRAEDEAAGGNAATATRHVVCKGAAFMRLFIAPHMAVACGS